MSCEIRNTAAFEGLEGFLRGDCANGNAKKRFTSCKMAYSPTGEIIVLAKNQKLVVCKSKWTSKHPSECKIVYSPSIMSDHTFCAEGETITCVLCLPFDHEGKNKQRNPDWTCIIVGFSTGYVRFYTAELNLLYSTIQHKEPVKDIKCYYRPKVCPLAADTNMLYVLYKDVICVAGVVAVLDALQSRPVASDNTFLPTTNYHLDFAKYRFSGQEVINDVCYIGPSIWTFSNNFEQLVMDSLQGFDGRPREPLSIFAISCGKKPFVAFHSDPTQKRKIVSPGTVIATALGSAIKTSVSINPLDSRDDIRSSSGLDWFGLNRGTKRKEPILEPGRPLNCEFGLCDLWRQGQSIILSPDCQFSAVSDSLGRVILIDNNTGVAQRMFKGYRDAQCGFVTVEEGTQRTKSAKHKYPRQALFLVIYSPKMGLIDIFATQTGRRVASFEVSEFGRLIYVWYNPNKSDVPSNTSTVATLNNVIFASEEGLKEFSIPFHRALADDICQVDSDLYILRKIKTILKLKTCEEFVREMEKCAKELQTDEHRLQALELVVVYKSISVNLLKPFLNVFTEYLKDKERAPKIIVDYVKLLQNVLALYEFIMNLENPPPKYETVVEEKKEEKGGSEVEEDGNEKESDKEGKVMEEEAKESERDVKEEEKPTADTSSLAEVLNLSKKELDVTLAFMEQIKEIDCIKKPKVWFRESSCRKLGEFLTLLDFERFVSCLENGFGEGEKASGELGFLNFKLNNKLKNDTLWSVGELLFKGLFSSVSALDDWKTLVRNCLLNPNHLALSLISYWCGKPFSDDFHSEVTSLVEILKAVCLLNGLDKVAVQCNAESPWWSQLRSLIADNPYTIQGLFGALCCRSVTISLEQEREMSKRADKKDAHYPPVHDWEKMSKDTCEWDIMITQLQDAALLNAILSLKFKEENIPRVLATVRFDFVFQCLSSIQKEGTGRVSELVAKWLLQFGFDPKDLVDEKDLEFQTGETPREETKPEFLLELNKASEGRSKAENLNLALEYLALLKKRFPYSLTCSALLANVSWEYVEYWHKHVTEFDYLEASYRCMEAIPSSRIMYGVAYLSWRTHLEKKFESLASMVNRIGTIPRDRFCLEEIGLRNEQTPRFMKLVREYLKVLSAAERDPSETENDFRTDREGIWQYSSNRKEGRSFVSRVLSQPDVDSSLLSLQLDVSTVVLIMAGLNVKGPSLNLLFGKQEQAKFLDSQRNLCEADMAERRFFLRKSVGAAVQTIELKEILPSGSSEGEVSESEIPSARLNIDEYTKWISLCSELARAWSIDQDFIRVHQILELYSSGYDHLAEEVIQSIYPDEELASQLLVLAGKRLTYMFQDSRFDHLKNIYYSSNIYNWTQTLQLGNFTYQSKSFVETQILLNRIISWFPEDGSGKKMALELLELLIILEDLLPGTSFE